LKEFEVKNSNEFQELFNKGNKSKTLSKTFKNNSGSSRSTTVFRIRFTDSSDKHISEIKLIDMPGTEWITDQSLHDKAQMMESVVINFTNMMFKLALVRRRQNKNSNSDSDIKSLCGWNFPAVNVIREMLENVKKKKKMIIIANLSPSVHDLSQTRGTLK